MGGIQLSNGGKIMKPIKILTLSSILLLVMSTSAFAHDRYRGSEHGYTHTKTVKTVTRSYGDYDNEVEIVTRTYRSHDDYGHRHKKWRRHHRHHHHHHHHYGHHHKPSHHYEKHVTIYKAPQPVYVEPRYTAPAPAAQYNPSHDPVSGTLVGGAFGAAAGAAIGAVVGSPGDGAAIGAVIGGLSGASRSLLGHGLW